MDQSSFADLSAIDWEQKYQTGNDRWDLGCPAPPFVSYLNGAEAPPPGRIAVLGCGAGHDAMLFAAAGFTVVGFDFAPSAIVRAQANASNRGLAIEFIERDIFDLGAFAQGFDYVLEHTCFCALDPSQRSAYVSVVQGLLKPGGQLIGLFFTHDRPGGPPFGIQPQTVLDYFAPAFRPVLFKPVLDSIEKRRGEEHFGVFELA